MTYNTSEIFFKSEATTCYGRLYLPLVDSAEFACVVMANGFSGTMDWILPDFAEGFAKNGFAVLAFDYRHLGRSGGEPRQVIDPDKQLTDLRNAIHFARRHPQIDDSRIILWGTSLGGGYVLKIAAEDHRIAAVIGNMPAIDAIKGGNLKGKMQKSDASATDLIVASLRLFWAASIDLLKSMLSMKPNYVNVYGAPGKAIFTDPELATRFATVEKQSPTWQNKVAARFIFKAPRYQSGTFERIQAPIFLALATLDVEVSTSFIRKKSEGAARVEIIEYPFGHFDLYHGDIFKKVLADQIFFLKKHMS